MRGRKTSQTARKDADMVVVAARYDQDGKRLEMVQAFRRRGPVWGDVKLLPRAGLLAALQQGARVYTGCYADLLADFEVFSPVQLSGSNGVQAITVPSKADGKDALDVPIF